MAFRCQKGHFFTHNEDDLLEDIHLARHSRRLKGDFCTTPMFVIHACINRTKPLLNQVCCVTFHRGRIVELNFHLVNLSHE
jgi:hypothetical protein|eukprot:COSAG01_NODE_132_length_24759_cov_13.862298_40_plen_81_part_00